LPKTHESSRNAGCERDSKNEKKHPGIERDVSRRQNCIGAWRMGTKISAIENASKTPSTPPAKARGTLSVSNYEMMRFRLAPICGNHKLVAAHRSAGIGASLRPWHNAPQKVGVPWIGAQVIEVRICR
jgi:hypothetical protein